MLWIAAVFYGLPEMPELKRVNGCKRSRGGRHRLRLTTGWLLLLAGLSLWEIEAADRGGRGGVVVSVHPTATAAGIRAFDQGGNAIDAAVATALTLGVVDGHNSGLGGGCFILMRLADGTVEAIDGRETAPLRITAAHYRTNGQADLKRSQFGPLAVGVPGALAAYDHALRHGKIRLKDHLLAAAVIAENGFTLDAHYQELLTAWAADLKIFPASRQIFLGADGGLRRAGDILRQADLAKSYRAIAEAGISWFYDGPFARGVAAWMESNGGVLTVEDFRRYRIKLREPLRTTYRGFEIIGFPPPSSGGVHVAQILNILEHFEIGRQGQDSAAAIHLMTEAMKLAFADRAYWLGDPDFVKVPLGLIAKDYGATLARQISTEEARTVAQHGAPPGSDTEFFGGHTTHFCAADADGNWVACTATLNTSFGSKVVVPGTGILLNNQMDDFSLHPGMGNYFGLIGGEANAIAPGKRPLSSMSPTIVLKGGEPVFSIGAAGGPTIISQVVLGLTGFIDFGLDAEGALRASRFHHQWKPDRLQIEKSVPEAVLAELKRRGHQVAPVDRLGAAQAMSRNPATQVFTGAADPRGSGKATVW